MTYLEGNHAIKTQTHHYIRYADGSEELYADDDPWNITNLAIQPEQKPVLQRHRELMDEALENGN
ncbi:hypothetical protein [Pontiella sulfatireligans]|uniref:N-sulphoglucosamine sulphohydrolase C-terminal domain-containing protein n=1 Tax=Pontiella sulfatireligans TaxID=2750658 RepID=A0A6C2URI0_9BACT|nr:hypothetical protein [Pontiella sulfatireligans]VGO21851.1 hypothetical protein SCARR_03931 [Pontiella sulfatireligans]